MSYQLNKAHLLICIFAGLVLTGGFVWLIFFGAPFPLFTMAMWVSAGIIIFYVIGQFARSILVTDIFPPPEEEEEELEEDPDALMDEEGAMLEEAEDAMPQDVMYNEPLHHPEMMEYEDALDDPFMNPSPLDNAS